MTKKISSFRHFGFPTKIEDTLAELGYENPTPIQEHSISVMMKGGDIVAQAETGTGKTAAFALPILSRLDLKKHELQVLVLAPTRELAIQVAEAFKRYGRNLNGFQVVPIYGGQDYNVQLKALKRGVHVVVGTPGRVMDHIRRKTLNLDHLEVLVLDEADEMLNMGFQEDVEWILEQTPETHQTALFSATMPDFIRKMVTKYLVNPEKIQIKAQASAIPTITQYATIISNNHKLEALTRFLEVKEFEAAIIFTRTKTSTVELAERLAARGYTVAALNGDIKQSQRERVISHLKNGKLDIVVATDVAARGLDVPRISFVVNFDMPHDIESYIHRIGRTGRAGRKGDALLFVAPREQRMLMDIERVTKQSIEMVNPPTANEINDKRTQSFNSKVLSTLANKDLNRYRELVETLVHKSECSEMDVAAALISLLEGDLAPFDQKADIHFVDATDQDRDGGRRRQPRGPRKGGDRQSSYRGGNGGGERRQEASQSSYRGGERRSSERPSYAPKGNRERAPSSGNSERRSSERRYSSDAPRTATRSNTDAPRTATRSNTDGPRTATRGNPAAGNKKRPSISKGPVSGARRKPRDA